MPQLHDPPETPLSLRSFVLLHVDRVGRAKPSECPTGAPLSVRGTYHEQVKFLLVPGNHLVHRLVVGHFIFFLEGFTHLVRVRRGWGGRRPGSEASGGGPWEMSWRSQSGCGGWGPTRQREAHTHTHTHAPWDQGPCWPSQPRSRGLNGHGD